MKKLYVFSLFLLLSTLASASYDSVEFELEIPDNYFVVEYKEDLQSWHTSLLRGLGYKERKITEAIFLKTDIPLKVDGETRIGEVYQNKDSKKQFYILPSKTIVDFNLEKVGSMGVAGISQHPTPSKRMVIVLAPQVNTYILGVALDFSGKVSVSPPSFKTRKVTYEWYEWEKN